MTMRHHQPASAVLEGQRRVVVDVEGNGQQPAEIVELAVVTIDGGMLSHPQSWLVKPDRPITALVTRKVHGISNADVADAPPFIAIRDQVQALLADAWLVAHNAHIEVDILAPQLPGWSPCGVLDTLRLARALWPGRASYGLDALIEQERLDLSPVAATSRRHRAAYDAYATALLLLRLVDTLRADEQSFDRLAALALPQRPPAPSTSATSGQDAPLRQDSLWSPSSDQPGP
jgi:DNA polymerase III epsilon subunit-like protein